MYSIPRIQVQLLAGSDTDNPVAEVFRAFLQSITKYHGRKIFDYLSHGPGLFFVILLLRMGIG